MIHDHEAVALAVASLDFELSPGERQRLEAGLSECTECAEIAASHRDVARLLDRLPVHDASPQVRQRVMRAALVPPRDRRWPILLAVAALLALSIAAAGAAGALRERQPLDQSVVPPSASIPALGDVALPEPSTSTAPDSSESVPGSTAAFVAGPPLAPDTIAEVVSGRLRIRSEPRIAVESIKYEPLLEVGDRLLILDGPVVANEYEWYQVTAWRPDDPDYEGWPTGWVSRGDHNGDPWIRPRAEPCPTGPITMDVVAAMQPPERVACFGDQPLRLRGYVSGEPGEPCTPDPETACIDGPSWLTGFDGWEAGSGPYAETGSIGGLRLAVDPNGPVPPSALQHAGMVDLEGAFDHPAARDCRAGRTGPATQPVEETVARLSCRARFVVTAVRSDPDYPVARAAGITVSDGLRVRSEPGLTGDRYELLPEGTAVWVVDGPVIAADYEWFQVIVPSIDTGDGLPRVGWVAASDHGRERWLATRTLDCPDRTSLDVEDLMRLATLGSGDDGFGCYGSSTIRFEGSVGVLCGVEDRPGWEMRPEWLSGNAYVRLTIRDGDAFVVANPSPNVAVPAACGEADAGRFSIVGHFGDDTSWECEAFHSDGRGRPDSDLVAQHWCEVTLVVDRLVPLAPSTPSPSPSPPPPPPPG